MGHDTVGYAAQNLRAVGDRIEDLLAGLRASLDPVTWRTVEEVLSLVTDLYGGGLAAVIRTVHSDDAGGRLMAQLVEDELVSSLLVLHGLHPSNLDERVRAALVDVRPYLMSHGGDVEILEIDEASAMVRLQLLGSCDGCPSSSVTLKHAVEQAIMEAAPEVAKILVEGYVEPEPVAPPASPITLTVKPSRVPVGS